VTRSRHEMTGGIGSADAKQLLGWIKRKRLPTFREADIGADLRRFRDDPRSLAAAIKALLAVDAIRPRLQTYTRGRTPTPAYDVHPEILRAPENPGNTGNEQGSPPDSSISGNSGISWRSGDEPESSDREGSR
jgi:hypothetical protein